MKYAIISSIICLVVGCVAGYFISSYNNRQRIESIRIKLEEANQISKDLTAKFESSKSNLKRLQGQIDSAQKASEEIIKSAQRIEEQQQQLATENDRATDTSRQIESTIQTSFDLIRKIRERQTKP